MTTTLLVLEALGMTAVFAAIMLSLMALGTTIFKRIRRQRA